MEDKTPMYLMSIVAMVAVVAVVYMLAGSGSSASSATDSVETSGSSITGNVVSEEAPATAIGTVGRFLLGVVLIGAFVYMYRKWD